MRLSTHWHTGMHCMCGDSDTMTAARRGISVTTPRYEYDFWGSQLGTHNASLPGLRLDDVANLHRLGLKSRERHGAGQGR